MKSILKTQSVARPMHPNQWKRKKVSKEDKCDICSRTFLNKIGVTIHKNKMHGIQVSQKNTLRKNPSITLNTKKESSVSGGSRPSSPSPKKIHVDIKDKHNVRQINVNIKAINSVKEKKSIEEMEQSGKPSERESDHKVDFNIQCDINPNELVKQLQIDLCLVKEELVELKTEKKQLKAHNARKQAGYEADYQEILIEKQRITVEMVKLQSQNDLLIEKVTVLESKAEAEQVDECVQVFRCEGNCDHVGCISEAKRLRNMKNQGSRRTSPVVEAVSVKQFRCPQCTRVYLEAKVQVCPYGGWGS